jgi:hypothetical protein
LRKHDYITKWRFLAGVAGGDSTPGMCPFQPIARWRPLHTPINTPSNDNARLIVRNTVAVLCAPLLSAFATQRLPNLRIEL